MTAPESVGEWCAARRLSVPEAFRPFVEPRRPEAPASTAALVSEARARLAQITGVPLREGAFHLLAADGFATWACERALDEEDPAAALHRLLDALSE